MTGRAHLPAHLPYVAPFAIFLILLVAGPHLHLDRWEYPVRVLILCAALLVFSRGVVSFRSSHVAGSVALGVGVFGIWIAPDVLWPGYRDHWLFQNSITGTVQASLPEQWRQDSMVLSFRFIRASVVVPIIEELFWRAWLLRWLIRTDFENVPLGAWDRRAFWVASLLFASEHGPFWDVGLLAGIAYNWWMVHTRSLGSCILAHAVTNAALSAYVLWSGKWEYWL